MNLKADSSDFYGLVTELCEGILPNHSFDHGADKRYKILKKMRTTAFEVLLKTPVCPNTNKNNQQKDLDATTELMKHAFVLRSNFACSTKADKLDEAMDRLQDGMGSIDGSLESVLQFLNYMKAYGTTQKNDLNIFHFGKQNPVLPEPRMANGSLEYNIYPTAAFELPYNIAKHSNRFINFSDLPINPPFSFPTPSNRDTSTNKLPMPYCFTPTLPMLMVTTDSHLEESLLESPSSERIPPTDSSTLSLSETSNVPFLNIPWSTSEPSSTQNKNWENLGNRLEPAPSTFILESENAIEHVQNFGPWSFDPQAHETKTKTSMINLSMEDFLEHIKLVLLGIESDSFIWNNQLGFVFKFTTTVPRISSETLKNISSEITHWATCFKLLTLLIRPGQHSTGKLREDSLIFRAMCNNIDEILLHYQAVILQVFGESSPPLFWLLHQVSPFGFLITEVARLCRCENVRQTLIGEGIGLLSHIYKEVTKITKPNIALVYYSILKSCCEVYFEYLEKWIFQGKCDETHGEFMINIKIPYLRNRGYKFWSKCYGINKDSVPGFLKNLTDSILQCGKAVRLLKICDPKNPMCTLFSTDHPAVKVSLNVNMLSEQEEICQEYMNRGIEILGNVTLRSALQQMRRVEKHKADFVIARQIDALQRIKKSQEEAKLIIAENKRELLANLKNQAEEAISRKERAREAKLVEEKLEIDRQCALEEDEKRLLLAEAKITADYYKELAEEAKKRKLRALWRTRRMILFDERVELIVAVKHAESVLGVDDHSILNTSDRKDENSNSSNTNSQDTCITPRPTALSLKEQLSTIESTNLILKSTNLNTDILHKISEKSQVLKSAKTLGTRTCESDKEKDETTEGHFNVDPNQNEESNLVDTVDNDHRTETTDNDHNCLGLMELNDATPMSCTTDSYHQSVSSSLFYNFLEAESLAGSKNDVETPMSIEEHLPQCDKQTIPESQSFFSGFGLDNGPTNFESSLTMADVELIDNTSLQIYLEKSVVIPLMVQSKLANSAVIKYLLEEHKILSHFQSLRSFFFLLNGEFARNLTGAIFTKFYEITMPTELFNSATLTNLLENAIHSSLNSSYENAELLSLSAIDTPSLLTLSDPEALDCLSLHYNISWPLNIILDEMLMQQYSKVFKFLLMVGRVLWVLQDDFCILKVERQAALSPQYHRLQLFRHAMVQFMTAFSNYLTCSVLHASWTEFEKELENATTIDEIYSIHVGYIKKILSRCMLTPKVEKFRHCLCNIFKIILKFHNGLRSHEWRKGPQYYTISNYAKLEQMYEAFCDLRTYPAQVVEKFASSGYQSHLTHFLDALNINPLYNLSTKGI